jgi:hypothetical protein
LQFQKYIQVDLYVFHVFSILLASSINIVNEASMVTRGKS